MKKMIVMSGMRMVKFEDADRKVALYEDEYTGEMIRLFVDSGEYEVIEGV